MAYAGALFADACLRGLNGEPNVVECSFVESNVTELPFFASKVKLGPKGAFKIAILSTCEDAKVAPDFESSLVPRRCRGTKTCC